MDKSEESSQEQAKAADRVKAEAIGQDRMQVEFRIDDLLRRIVEDRMRRIASCGGCNGCSA